MDNGPRRRPRRGARGSGSLPRLRTRRAGRARARGGAGDRDDDRLEGDDPPRPRAWARSPRRAPDGGELLDRAAALADRLPIPLEQAQTLLALGKLQRRRKLRRAARSSLARAEAIFESIGAVPWVDAARAEIARVGVRRAPDELTATETRVAELAASGLTNEEIAAQLFISRRTVEANLARAYRKLGIRSRAELGATMAVREPA